MRDGFPERIKINHHRADMVSVIMGSRRSELAFFREKKWVEMADPFLIAYWDGSDSNPVYSEVPNWLVEAFVNEYRA